MIKNENKTSLTTFIWSSFFGSKASHQNAESEHAECKSMYEFGSADADGVPHKISKILPLLAQQLDSENWMQLVGSVLDDGIPTQADINFIMSEEEKEWTLRKMLLIVFWFSYGIEMCDQGNSFVKTVVEASSGNAMG